MANDQQVSPLLILPEAGGKVRDTLGKGPEAFAIGRRGVLPVFAPGSVVPRVFFLQIAMVTHFPIAKEHLIQ